MKSSCRALISRSRTWSVARHELRLGAVRVGRPPRRLKQRAQIAVEHRDVLAALVQQLDHVVVAWGDENGRTKAQMCSELEKKGTEDGEDPMSSMSRTQPSQKKM